MGLGACGRVWGHVAGVVAGCGGMWLEYLVGGQAWGGTCGGGSGMWYGVRACGRVLGNVAGGRWQGVGACGRGWGYMVGGQAYGMGICGRGGDMW